MDSLFNLYAYRTQMCDDIVDEILNGNTEISVDEDLTQEELEYIRYRVEENYNS